MWFGHTEEIWLEFPELVPGALVADRITNEPTVAGRVARYAEIATTRLAAGSESELPEIQAWRRVYRRMGLEPTRYRCASEALLRRFRKEGSLPELHPLIDVCNAVSLAFAIPIAVFDVSKVADFLEVRRAAGTESYLAFSGEVETPAPREVIFADSAGRAHARRWTNRQSATSAVRDDSDRVLIVAEAVHDSAPADVRTLLEALASEIESAWSTRTRYGILTAAAPRFDL
ncbi:MAG TPA: phenylalanine--tRNA ligase beta subunit-related protein [Gaiellaceae bacterium]|nr:phenylalanine--tRNA ligase beta subunit-related protein [Gaiellaceae bacterium]